MFLIVTFLLALLFAAPTSCVVACISWTISKTRSFAWLRNWIRPKDVGPLPDVIHPRKYKKSRFYKIRRELHNLISCPFCVSYHVALPISFLFAFSTATTWEGFLLSWALTEIFLVWFAAIQWSIIALLWKWADL